ncbi:signal peptidase I [Cohnella caldifontis]|uniref:signal peptidase I n=1 Tax=Cohnella caldifontis TaxID=3027471 RepID=UPI0023ECAEFD|nr:signal peptidase I [Cohnella sp. YIM B05605]
MDERQHPESEEREPFADRTAANGANSETGEPGGTDAGDRSPEEPAAPRKQESSRLAGELVEWIKALAIAGLLVFVIRWLLVSPFIVDGPSMQPNFWDRERIIVNKIVYDIRKPKRGEVIVFHVPDEGRDFIKRVIGVPGDTVKVDGDKVYINGQQIEEPYLKAAYDAAHAAGNDYNSAGQWWDDFPNSQNPDGKVPEGALFVMGDNRSNSEDSRTIGFIPLSRVVGRADLVYWPLPDFHFIKH